MHGGTRAPVGIKYVSFNEPSGYGIAAARYIRGLVEAGVAVTWTPMAQARGTESGLWYGPWAEPSRTDPLLDDLCMRPIDYEVVLVHTVPEYYPSWRRREKGKTLVGYTTWETDTLPDHWPDLLNSMDMLLVPCQWNKSVMQRGGVTVPIAVVPHISVSQGGDTEPLQLARRPEDTVFYSINTWTWRKALWLTVEAYLKAFTASDPVLLVLKTSQHDLTRRGFWRYRPKTTSALRSIMREYPNPARIQLIADTLTESQIMNLHQQSHCYLSLTTGEGWGMGAFDAARAGNQVVITGYGGPAEFLPKTLAHLIDYREVPLAGPEVCASYQAGQLKADPDLEQAVDCLRTLYATGQASLENSALQAHITEHFNAAVVTAQLLASINLLREPKKSADGA